MVELGWKKVITYETSVNTRDAAPPEIPHRLNHLVDNLARVRLHSQHHLEVVRPALRILACYALDRHVRTAVARHFFELRDDALALGESRVVDDLELWDFGLAVGETPVRVDEDDARGTLLEGEDGSHLAYGACTPDGAERNVSITVRVYMYISMCVYVCRSPFIVVGESVLRMDSHDISLIHSSIKHCIVARSQDVREIQTGFIGDIIRQRKQIHVAERHADVLCLAACESSRQVAVTKHACRTPAVQFLLGAIGVCLFALRGEALFAEEALGLDFFF